MTVQNLDLQLINPAATTPRHLVASARFQHNQAPFTVDVFLLSGKIRCHMPWRKTFSDGEAEEIFEAVEEAYYNKLYERDILGSTEL